jgi:MOSC domain-containing protein YiiM
MQVISVNVGLPKDLPVGDWFVPSGIFKTPVHGSVCVRTLNLDGDGQADLTVHGGQDKAVYLYPSEHYLFWQQELGRQLEWGSLGENLTTAGITEENICAGDQLQIGSVVLQVTQPRLPCFKLAAKFHRKDIIETFVASRKTGFYTRVLHEGSLQAGDSIVLLQRDQVQLSIHELAGLYFNKQAPRAEIERALSVTALSKSWREYFQSMLTGSRQPE